MDQSAFSDLASAIYDASLDHASWPLTLERCCRFVGGSAGNLYFYQTSDAAKAVKFSWGNDPEFQRLYNETYTKLNPIYPASTYYNAGTVITQSDIVPPTEMQQTRFYKEWLEPQGIVDTIFGILQKSSIDAGIVAVRRYRQDGPVDAEARHRMSLIVPHIRRAILIGSALDFKQTAADVLAETLSGLSAAVFLLGPKASLVFTNPNAQRLLEAKCLFIGTHGVLRAVCSRTDKHLGSALLAAEGGDRGMEKCGLSIPLKSKNGNQWVGHVLPLTTGSRKQAGTLAGAVAALFVRPVETGLASALETVFHAYKLTAGELRVLKAVIESGGVPSVARELGLSEATVRTHLRNIFQKTGTNRQADLAKLVSGMNSPFAL